MFLKSKAYLEKLRNHPWISGLLLLLVIIGVYAPVTTRSFGFMDDYALLNAAVIDVGLIADFCTAGGRPVFGYILEGSLQLCNEIPDLRYLRFAGLLSLGAAGAALFFLLRGYGWSSGVAWLTALALAFTPSAQVGACWAIIWPQAASVALVVAAFLLLDNIYRRWPMARKSAAAGVAGGILLLIVAGLNYQPFLFFYGVCLLPGVLVSGEKGERIRWLAYHLVLFASACLAVLISYKLVLIWLDLLPLARVTFTVDPLGKLGWFVSRPLFNALATYALVETNKPPSIFAVSSVVLTSLIICSGFAFLWKRVGGRNAMFRIGCVLMLLPMAYGANLIVAENAETYRTLLALSAYVLVLVVWALREIFRGGTGKLRYVVPVLVGLFCLTGAVLAQRNARVYFERPQARELNRMRKLVKRAEIEEGDSVYMQRPLWNDTLAPTVINDEFGLPSSTQFWSAEGMFWCVFREIHPEVCEPGDFVTFRSGLDLTESKSGDVLLDMQKVMRKMARKQND